ncbi:carbohydrate ABC transporter permease [Phytoactinopolyspora halotolerans]|uniref:Carbohydrate ABC transporter permease n=1 Tax=Phytoactinopolyspora halotolerans TaxID=1981512 RepID=A0A6L9SG25_9ACTN|nr:carbohydrate ABC transporter permease [Phytoactinopolyspora halotolerans]NEE03391.1 carbohydrate ABC transporter permease [Phytoactinopolyspora halotolerans]
MTATPTMTRPGPNVARAQSRRRNRQPVEHTTLIVLTAFLLAPFAWFVSVAFRPKDQLYQLLPSSLTLSNFTEMVDRVPDMVAYYTDSIIITFSAVVIIAVGSALAGFAFARLSFPGRDVLLWMIVATIFIPHPTVVASLWVQLFEMELLDTRLGLTLVYAAWGFAIGTFIMRNVFKQIPIELEQSARVDGASSWQILWRIYIPLAMGGMVVVSMLSFVHIWGEYLFAFTFAGENVIPMSLGIQFFQPSGSDPTYTFNVAAAAGLVMFVPSLVIYIGFQRWFSRGTMEGALKG